MRDVRVGECVMRELRIEMMGANGGYGGRLWNANSAIVIIMCGKTSARSTFIGVTSPIYRSRFYM
jgi:hypothetical protein